MKLSQLKGKACGITATEVETYLRSNPDFLLQRPDLLEDIELRHECGDAVSLISRQVELLRQKNSKLSVQLNDILQIARDNDAVSQKIHKLTLSLLGASSLSTALESLRKSMHECFQADFVEVRLAEPMENISEDLFISNKALSDHDLIIEKPECCQPKPQQSNFLFGENSKEVNSMALVPLQYHGLKGFLAIGSRDPHRFDVKMGNLFLSRIGEIVAARLATLLKPPAH